jgi:hypothetical protein
LKFDGSLALFISRLYRCRLAVLRRAGGWLVASPDISDHRIDFRLDADDLFELDALGDGFAGLARQYEKVLVSAGMTPQLAPAKLYITKIRAGSLSFEIGTSLLTVYGAAHAVAENAVLFDDFFKRLREYFDYFVGKGSRPATMDRSDVSDFDGFLKTIAGKRGAALRIRRAVFKQTTGRSRVVAEFEFDAKELATAGATIASELGQSIANAEPAKVDKNHKLERAVPFIWFRTDREKGKARGTTSDRGIIAKITEKPLPVFFPSETDEAKQRMTKVKQNPFDLVYIVDALVEYNDEGEPVSYTITDLSRIA